MSENNSTPQIERLNPETLHPVTEYSHVVQVRGGRTVYVAGQIALDQQGVLVGAGDFEQQARQVMVNLAMALHAMDLDFSHVVKMTVFVTDRHNMGTFRKVRREFIEDTRLPAVSAVQVAALVRDDLLLEVEAIAVGEGS